MSLTSCITDFTTSKWLIQCWMYIPLAIMLPSLGFTAADSSRQMLGVFLFQLQFTVENALMVTCSRWARVYSSTPDPHTLLWFIPVEVMYCYTLPYSDCWMWPSWNRIKVPMCATIFGTPPCADAPILWCRMRWSGKDSYHHHLWLW